MFLFFVSLTFSPLCHFSFCFSLTILFFSTKPNISFWWLSSFTNCLLGLGRGMLVFKGRIEALARVWEHSAAFLVSAFWFGLLKNEQCTGYSARAKVFLNQSIYIDSPVLSAQWNCLLHLIRCSCLERVLIYVHFCTMKTKCPKNRLKLNVSFKKTDAFWIPCNMCMNKDFNNKVMAANCTLLKIKLLYWHSWLYEEPVIYMEIQFSLQWKIDHSFVIMN